MTYRPTILNITSALYMTGCIIYTIIKYDVLSQGEGWGVVGMVGLFGVGVLALLADMLVQLIIRNRKICNLVGILVGIEIAVLFFNK